MAPSKRSIFARAILQSLRGLVLLASVLTSGYVFASKLQAPEARAVQALDDDGDDGPKAAQPPVSGHEEPIVKLGSEGQEKGGIETAAPKEIIYQGQVRAYGVILSLDRLTSLYNNAITASLQLKSAEIKLAASKTANIRAQNLLKLFPTAASQAELAEATYDMDAAGVDSAQAQVEAVSNAAVQEWGPVLGQAIVTKSELAEQLVLRKTCLTQLTLQPGAKVEAPEKISVTFGSGATAEGDFISEATQADPKIPNVSFFYAIPCAQGALAGMTLAAMFPNGKARPGIDIPPSAVIWQAGKPWMYVQAGMDLFERRAIGEEAAPTADGGYILPVANWPRDKLIVVAGAQTLLSEESKSQGKSEEDDN